MRRLRGLDRDDRVGERRIVVGCDRRVEARPRERAHPDPGPIEARDESRAYRIGTFLRRRWPVVAAAVVFLVLLASYAVTVTIQARLA